MGGAIRKFIDDEAREATLTIPRFRRDQPPTHVLLAPNGDLLRGQLLGVNETELQFESRLEQLRVPRQRVAGIIWMKPVAESTAPAAATDPAATEPVTTEPVAPVPLSLLSRKVLFNCCWITDINCRLSLCAWTVMSWLGNRPAG